MKERDAALAEADALREQVATLRGQLRDRETFDDAAWAELAARRADVDRLTGERDEAMRRVVELKDDLDALRASVRRTAERHEASKWGDVEKERDAALAALRRIVNAIKAHDVAKGDAVTPAFEEGVEALRSADRFLEALAEAERVAVRDAHGVIHRFDIEPSCRVEYYATPCREEPTR